MWTTLISLDLNSVGLALSLGLIFLVLSEIIRIISSKSKTPPGPTPRPFVGTIPYFVMNPMEFIRSLSQYGEMTTLYFGRKPVIVLNTIQTTKEALIQNGSSFSGRAPLPVLDWITDGFGKIFDPQHAIQNAVSNIICFIVFEDRFDYDNKRFEYLLNILKENIIQSGSLIARIFNLFPFIKLFPGPHQKIYQNAEELKGFIREAVQEHRENLTQTTHERMPTCWRLKLYSLVFDADLFLAGTDTTSTTIRWGLIFLMQNQDAQDRCHEEIVRVLGYDRLPTMDDREKLPYTYATVHEIQRCGNIATTGVVHETTQPTILQGYNIPKRIHFLWPSGEQWPDMDGIVSVVRSPRPFNIICHSRASKE